jgi:hypothetical protein
LWGGVVGVEKGRADGRRVVAHAGWPTGNSGKGGRAMDWTKPFAVSDTTKMFLDDAEKFWIEVRDELGHDEQRTITMASIKGVSRTTTGEQEDKLVEIDLGAGADRKVMTYLVDWNLTREEGGKTFPIDISTEALKRDALKHLTPAHYRVIAARIDAHVLEMAKKKVLSGNPMSVTI